MKYVLMTFNGTIVAKITREYIDKGGNLFCYTVKMIYTKWWEFKNGTYNYETILFKMGKIYDTKTDSRQFIIDVFNNIKE